MHINDTDIKIKSESNYETHLDSCFGQAGLGSQSFTGAHARVMALVELLFQFVQLVRTERGPVASELWLLGSATTTHALHVIFTSIHTTGTIAY